MTKLFRILTESGRDNDEHIRRIVGQMFDAYTLIYARGTYQGTEELSAIVEINTAEHNRHLVYAAAEKIRLANKQQEVLVQELAVDTAIINEDYPWNHR